MFAEGQMRQRRGCPPRANVAECGWDISGTFGKGQTLMLLQVLDKQFQKICCLSSQQTTYLQDVHEQRLVPGTAFTTSAEWAAGQADDA